MGRPIASCSYVSGIGVNVCPTTAPQLISVPSTQTTNSGTSTPAATPLYQHNPAVRSTGLVSLFLAPNILSPILPSSLLKPVQQGGAGIALTVDGVLNSAISALRLSTRFDSCSPD
jgi:hypothetical protein